MYLFAEDLATHRGIIDIETPNKSFLRMSVLLAKMGIKNNKFFLWLSQPDLQGIDPHNLKDNSVELKQRIAFEAKINFFYYIREVLRIPVQGDEPIPYILDRANLAMNWLFMISIDAFMTQPRQTGKTASAGATNTWCMYVGYKNSNIGLFAKDGALQVENVSQIKDMRRSMPAWFIAEGSKDLDNREGISYNALGNEYKTYIAKPDKLSARKQGRGEKLGRQHWDEFNFYINNDLSYATATSASDAAADQLRKAGLPAANIITSTAGRLCDPPGAYGFSIKSNCARFTEKVYDLQNRDAVLTYLKTQSCNQMFYLEFSYKQLGRDEAWFEHKTRDKTQEQIEMDYLNIWQHGTSTAVVPQHLLSRIRDSVTEPMSVQQHGPLQIRWYIDRDLILNDEKLRKRNYIIGLDTSDNVGRDFTTMVITDPSDLTVLAVCRCNLPNMVHVVSCITELMTMLPGSILIPERNRSGAMVIDIIIEMLLNKKIVAFHRIYNTFIQDHNENTPDFNDIDLGDGNNRRHFGFNTSSAKDSRSLLYSKVLISMLNYMATRVFDADLASEMASLTVRNGRVDHPIGSNDDTCVAWLLTGFFILFGKNHHFYGIPRGEVLKTVTVGGDKVDEFAKERQSTIRRRIGELRGLILGCRNTMVRVSYEQELRHLESLVDNTIVHDDLSTFDQVIHNTDERTVPTMLQSRFINRFF